jgi:hypothetical protein
VLVLSNNDLLLHETNETNDRDDTNDRENTHDTSNDRDQMEELWVLSYS